MAPSCGLVTTHVARPCSRARAGALYNVNEPDRDKADSEIDVRVDSDGPELFRSKSPIHFAVIEHARRRPASP